MVFDSWERLGQDNDKLLYPFYSKFAKIAEDTHGISKVSIGAGGNTPIRRRISYRIDENVSKLNGTFPYYDGKSQYVILDKEHKYEPYDFETKTRQDLIEKVSSLLEVEEAVLDDTVKDLLVSLAQTSHDKSRLDETAVLADALISTAHRGHLKSVSTILDALIMAMDRE